MVAPERAPEGAKAARVKHIPFSCEITDPPGTICLVKNIYKLGSDLIIEFGHWRSRPIYE